jgi:hypothetical protein
MWQPDGWAWRARIGVLTPHGDVGPECEFRAMAPEGVSVHAARVPLGAYVAGTHGARWDCVARISGADALTPDPVPAHARRTDSGRPSSSIRFRARTAMATSVARRQSIREQSPSPITRL